MLALFPEGVSHSDPEMRPLKTGAARIALSAEAEHDGRLGVTVVPVGLSYEHKTTFRSSVLLVVGEPIDVAARLPAYRQDERAAVTSLTDEIGARLDEVVLQAESRELLAGIARVARWTSDPKSGDDPNDPAAGHRRARELSTAYARMRASDPARLEAIVAGVRSYWQTLRRLGVRDPWALELTAPRVGTLAAAVAKLVIAAPLAALGAIMGWIPYRFAGWIAPRVTKDEDILSTVKLFAGTLFLILGWTAEALAVGWLCGAHLGAADVRARRRRRLRGAALRGAVARRRGRVARRLVAGAALQDGAASGRAPPHAGRRRGARARRRARHSVSGAARTPTASLRGSDSRSCRGRSRTRAGRRG